MCNGIAIVGIVPDRKGPIKFYGKDGNSSHDKILSEFVPIELHNRSFKIEYMFPHNFTLDAPDAICKEQAINLGIAEKSFGKVVLKIDILLQLVAWMQHNQLKHDTKTLQNANLVDADLFKADLHDADMSRANLEGADLEKADLHGAIMQEANLQRTNLQHTNMRGVDLERANMRESDIHNAYMKFAYANNANLQFADLSNANLQEANLDEADLRGANLRGTDTKRASMYGTILPDVITVKTLQERGNVD